MMPPRNESKMFFVLIPILMCTTASTVIISPNGKRIHQGLLAHIRLFPKRYNINRGSISGINAYNVTKFLTCLSFFDLVFTSDGNIVTHHATFFWAIIFYFIYYPIIPPWFFCYHYTTIFSKSYLSASTISLQALAFSFNTKNFLWLSLYFRMD